VSKQTLDEKLQEYIISSCTKDLRKNQSDEEQSGF